MSDARHLGMSLLEAIEVFNSKPPKEWTAAEMVAFRDRLEQSPSLLQVLGGRERIDCRLAEVTLALAQAEEKLAAAAAAAREATPVVPSVRSPRRIRRYLEAAAFALLLGAAVAGVCLALMPDKKKPVGVPHAGATVEKHHADSSQPQSKQVVAKSSISSDDSKATLTPGADGNWEGWSIAASNGAKFTTAQQWDRSDPSNLRPRDVLTLEGGPVTLTQRFTIADDQRWLEADARPMQPVEKSGRIIVRLGGAQIAEASIGTGDAKFPVYVSLESSKGKTVRLDVTFEPSEAGQRIAWWSLSLAANQRVTPRSESPLANGLSSEDPKVRIAAAGSIAQTQDSFALAALIRSLNDRDAQVRLAAADALTKFNVPRVRTALRTALAGHADLAVRIRIAQSFSSSPVAEDVTSLMRAIDDRHAQVRLAAADALFRLGMPQTRAALRAALIGHADLAVRIQIAQSFSTAPVAEDAGALVAALANSDNQLRSVALQALINLGNARPVEPLVQALNDVSPSIREAAAAALAQLNHKDVDAALLKALAGHPDTAVRLQAARHFQTFPNSQAIDALRATLQAKNESLRIEAVTALNAIKDPKSTRALILALADKEPRVYQSAAVALAQRKDAAADEALLKALASHPNTAVRLQAAYHFEFVPGLQGTDALQIALRSENDSLRRSVVQALGAIDHPKSTLTLIPVLDDADTAVRQAAGKALVLRNDPTVDAAFLKALASHPDTAVRQQAAEHFTSFPNAQAINALQAVLQHKSESLRLQAVRSLGAIINSKSTLALIAALDDTEANIRQAAAASLAQRKDLAIDAAFMKALAGSPDMNVRQLAVAYVQAAPTPEVISALEGALRSENDSFRLSVAQALGAINHPKSTHALIPVLDDADAIIRLAAAQALVSRNDLAVDAAFLKALASHSDAAVRQQAANHFQSFPNPQAIDALRAALQEKDESLRLQAVSSLGALDDSKSTLALILALDDAEANIRQAAVSILAQRKSPAVDAVFLKALAGSPDMTVRQMAAAHIQSFPSLEGIQLLARALASENDALRLRAVQALCGINDPKSTLALIPALDDADTGVRETAIQTLTQRKHEATDAAVLKALTNHAGNSTRQQADYRFDAEPNPRAIDALRIRLLQGNDAARLQVVNSLAGINEPKATIALVRALDDSEASVRLTAATALAQRKGPTVVEAFLKALRSSPDMAVRQVAAGYFQLFPSPAGIAALEAVLHSENDALRLRAVQALGGIQGRGTKRSLIPALEDADPNIRQTAAKALAQHKDDVVDKVLLKALANHPDTVVRQQAASYFQSFPNPRAVDALQRALQNGSTALRAQAAHALGAIIDPKSAFVLIPALADADMSVRQAAAMGLAKHKDPAIDAAFVKALAGSPDMNVRQQAVAHIQAFPSPEGIQALEGALRHENDALRARVVQALVAINDPKSTLALTAALDDADATVRLTAVQTLAQRKDPAVDAALLRALASHADFSLRQQAALYFQTFPNPLAIDALRAALQNGDTALRLRAVNALGAINDPKSTHILIPALKDADTGICQAAATVLVQRRDPAVSAAFLKALADSPDMNVRQQAAAYIQSFPSPAGIQFLEGALRSENEALRLRSVQALGAINDPKSTRALIPVLDDADESVRQTAASALAQRKDPAVDAVFLKALAGHPDTAVRQQSAIHFQAFPNPQAIPALQAALGEESESLRLQAVNSLRAMNDPKSTRALISALDDADTGVRQSAAAILASRKDEAVDATLLKVLTSHPDNMVRQQAAAHFQSFPSPRAIGPLTEALKMPDYMLRQSAVEALGRIGGDAVIDVLRSALGDSNPSVRQAAVQALIQMNLPKAMAVLKDAHAVE